METFSKLGLYSGNFSDLTIIVSELFELEKWNIPRCSLLVQTHMDNFCSLAVTSLLLVIYQSDFSDFLHFWNTSLEGSKNFWQLFDFELTLCIGIQTNRQKNNDEVTKKIQNFSWIQYSDPQQVIDIISKEI